MKSPVIDWYVTARFGKHSATPGQYAFARVIRARTAWQALKAAQRTVCDTAAYDWEGEPCDPSLSAPTLVHEGSM